MQCVNVSGVSAAFKCEGVSAVCKYEWCQCGV